VHRLGDDPIHYGMPRAWKTPTLEVYYYARGPAKNLHVLSYGFDQHTGMNWPLEWTVGFGRRRIYSSTFGHVWKGDVQPPELALCRRTDALASDLAMAGQASGDSSRPPGLSYRDGNIN
jgi:hypothetical protein